jgi:hypothetical protein
MPKYRASKDSQAGQREFALDAPYGRFAQPNYPRRLHAATQEDVQKIQGRMEFLVKFEMMEPYFEIMSVEDLALLAVDARTAYAGRKPRPENIMDLPKWPKKLLISHLQILVKKMNRRIDPDPAWEIVETGEAGQALYKAIAEYRDDMADAFLPAPTWDAPSAKFPNAKLSISAWAFDQERACINFHGASGRSRGLTFAGIDFHEGRGFGNSNALLTKLLADHESPERGGRSMVIVTKGPGSTEWKWEPHQKSYGEGITPAHYEYAEEVTIERLLAGFQSAVEQIKAETKASKPRRTRRRRRR